MTMNELKSGFFGYQKASVYQYITSLEEEFSARLAQQEEEARQAAEQYRQRIDQLEEELRAVRQQYEAQRNEQMVIASTLMEAQRYAGQLRQEAEERLQEEQQRLDEAAAAQNRELDQYRARVEELRESLLSMLREMDGAALRLEERIEEVQDSCPDHNLSLFSRRPEPVA